MGIGLKIKCKEEEHITFMMGLSIEESGRTTSKMVLGHTSLQMELSIKESGSISLCMELDSSLITLAKNGQDSLGKEGSKVRTRLNLSRKRQLLSKRYKLKRKLRPYLWLFLKQWQRVIKKHSNKT